MKKMQMIISSYILLFSAALFAQFAGGDGTEGNPYQISTPEELNSVRDYPDANFILLNDIDLTDYLTDPNPGYNAGAFWEPIGSETNKFKGNFNGNNFKISGLKINRPEKSLVGLFSVLGSNTKIYNLEIVISDEGIIGFQDIGGLAGNSENSEINNIDIKGKINGDSNIGAIIGIAFSSTINLCSSECNISGITTIGGLVGYVEDSVVLNSNSKGTVIGENSTGGLVGLSFYGTINSCFSTCDVSGVVYIGGLIGGSSSSNISSCFYSGFVQGNSLVGGLFGLIGDSDITSCYSSESVAGASDKIGGLAGYSFRDTISDCYSTSKVSGNAYTGGLLGVSESSSVTNCYSIGSVSGLTDLGGLIGSNTDSAVLNSYWDTETSGQTTSAGGEGKTTAEMKSIDTYSGWDFTTTPIWCINGYLNGGYPYLNWDDRFHFAGGVGTVENPFLVSNADELNNVRNGLGANFRQTADIDLGILLTQGKSGYNNGAYWEPIGKDSTLAFTGNFDGNGFIINNLKINRPETDYVGLFGYVVNCEIQNASIQIDPSSGIYAHTVIGGLIGKSTMSFISNCSANGVIEGETDIGGISGYIKESTVSDCFSGVSIVGWAGIGGLIGGNEKGSIIRCSSSGEIIDIAGGYCIGGLVGANDGYLFDSFSNTDVKGESKIGGLVGLNFGDSIVNCYATGIVSGQEFGTDFGGLVGDNCGQITNSYSLGIVTGGSNTGGLIGCNSDGGYTTSCYWDIDTSGQTSSAGGEGKTTAEMKSIDTYSGWDFTTPVWRMNTYNFGYPWLDWQGLLGIEEQSNIPKVTELYQNYPNPFNPSTEIKFALNKASDVKLTVYNTKGQMVKELVNMKMEAGYHRISFDASGLNSGIYFYRLNYGDKVITRKMTMIK